MSAKARTHPSVTESAEPSEAPPGSKLPPAGRKTDAPLPAGLYLVATPIGNLGHISRRALDVLRRANRIACADTRVTRKLLTADGLATPPPAYHAPSDPPERRRLPQAVADGQAVPPVSDPGPHLVPDPDTTPN